MKFGIADYGMNVWDGGLYDIETRLEELKAIGFDGTERLEAVTEADALHKAARYRKLGMDFSTCRGPSVQIGIEWSAALGKDYVWITPGENSRTIDFDLFCRRTNRMVDICAKLGLKAGIHNHLGQRVENQQELEDFLRKCPDAGIVFDTGHLSAAGGDPTEIVQKYASRICVMHLKDVVLKENGEFDRFCELGAGNNGLDNRQVMSALVEEGYDGWVHIEHDTHLNDPLVDLAKSYHYLIDAGFSNK
jgi:sugar phosphate isomerase/epimerase